MKENFEQETPHSNVERLFAFCFKQIQVYVYNEGATMKAESTMLHFSTLMIINRVSCIHYNMFYITNPLEKTKLD